jgi:hypothetical protein
METAADTWVLELRKAYDQLIEDYLLAGVVRRSSQHVRVRNLHDVTWTRELVERIDAAMKPLSSKAHHEALEHYPKALPPDRLEALLDEYAELRKLARPGRLRDEDPGDEEEIDAA